jgi:DNA-binding transcriptional ArsR family regulator
MVLAGRGPTLRCRTKRARRGLVQTRAMNTSQVARIAAMVGEPARAGMLLALMDGRSLTANELAAVANVTAPTASRHLALLVDAGLLRVNSQGRHRYHRLASPEVARVLEGIMQLAASPSRAGPPQTGPRDPAMRLARTCYDHLAGRIAVALADRLVEDGAVEVEEDTAVLTPRAAGAVQALGLALPTGIAHAGRPACRPCLDWGERRMHLAGRFGALLCTHCLEQGWLLRRPGSRTLTLTPRGATTFRDWLGLARWNAVLQEPA